MVRSRIELIGSGGGLRSRSRTWTWMMWRTSSSWKAIMMRKSGTWLVMGGSDLETEKVISWVSVWVLLYGVWDSQLRTAMRSFARSADQGRAGQSSSVLEQSLR